jgi:hypothetical protein
LPASDVSILTGSRLAPAIAAIRIDKAMKIPPRIAVERVRKSAAPRAVMNPDELPPTPRPPPSERCIRMTPIRAAATTVWTISRKANTGSAFFGSEAGDLAASSPPFKGVVGGGYERSEDAIGVGEAAPINPPLPLPAREGK